MTGDFLNDLIEHIARTRSKFCLLNGQQIGCAQSLEEFELDLMNERSALKRIELVDRLGNLAWCKPVNSLKEKLVRTGCISLGARSASSCAYRVRASQLRPEMRPMV